MANAHPMSAKTADRSGLRGLSPSLVPLALMSLANGLSYALVLPFLSLFLTTDVHADPTQITVFLIAAPISGVLVSSWIGRLSDRVPSRRKILIGVAAAGIGGAAVTSVARDYWVLLAIAVTATAVSGSLYPQTFAYARQVAERDNPRRAAMSISALRTTFSLAWVGGPPLAALVVQLGGFRLVYALAAAMFAIAALVATFWLADIGPPVSTQSMPPSQDVEGPRPSVFRGTLPLTIAAFILLQIPIPFGLQAMPLFVGHDLHREATDAGYLFGLCAALEIPLMLGLGALTVRYRLRTLILTGAVCGVAYCVTVLTTPNLGILAAAQILNAIFISAVTAVGISYMQEQLSGRPGYATTLFINTFPIGAAIAGPLTGISATIGYRPGYGIAAGLCAVGFVLLLAARPRPENRRRRVSLGDEIGAAGVG